MSKRFTTEVEANVAQNEAVDASIERAKTIIKFLDEDFCPICRGKEPGEGVRLHAWDKRISAHRSERPLKPQHEAVQWESGRQHR